MTIKTTRYSPDTCECVIEYEWDDTLSETNRTHTLKTFVNRCDDHSILASDTDRWNAVFEENPRKNQAHQLILDNGPASLYDVQPDGTRIIKGNIIIDLSWSGTAPNRVLTISYIGITLTNQQRNNIQNALNTRFGVGQVILG